jgi:hypothetical protein
MFTIKMLSFWNNLYHVHTQCLNIESDTISKSLGARNQNGLCGIATMDYGHLCESENTLSFTCTAQKDTRLTLLTNYDVKYRTT